MTVRRGHLTLALAALAAAVLYNVWYFVLRPAASVSSRAAAERPLAGPAAAMPGDAAVDPLTIPAPPAIDLASAPAWRRDPFLFGDETRSVARPAVPAPAAARPSVRTILYSAGRRLAIVNGRIVGVGDAVGDYTVSDIEKDAVVFRASSGDRLRVPIHATGSGAALR